MFYPLEMILLPAVVLASAAIQTKQANQCGVRIKEDKTPVTEADMASHQAISEWIYNRDPSAILVSEESDETYLAKQSLESFWIADPLDGTSEFLAGDSEYGVCLARIEKGIPVMGAIALPATGQVFWGVPGLGAFSSSIPLERYAQIHPSNVEEWCRILVQTATPIYSRNALAPNSLRVLCSRRHGDSQTEALLSSLQGAQRMVVGACVKFLYLAQGKADYYPRLAHLHEWDIAAGHAILVAAGGTMCKYGTNEEIRYGNSGFISPWFESRS